MDISKLSGQGQMPLVSAGAASASPPVTRTAEVAEEAVAREATGPPAREEQAQYQAAETGGVTSGGVRMRIDEASRRVIAQILDENRNVVKQIPPEEVLKLSANFRRVQGLLFDEKV